QWIDSEPVADIARKAAQHGRTRERAKERLDEGDVVLGTERGDGQGARDDEPGYPEIEPAHQDQQGLPAGGEADQRREHENRADADPAGKTWERQRAVSEHSDQRHDLDQRVARLDALERGPDLAERPRGRLAGDLRRQYLIGQSRAAV